MLRKLAASSRLMPNVVWVRSLVPNEKNSAVSAISAARSAARGSSIMVPTMYSSFWPDIWLTSAATWSTTTFIRSSSFLVAINGIMISGITVLPAFFWTSATAREEGGALHRENRGKGDAEPHAAMAEHRIELMQLGGACVDLGEVDA